MTGGVKLFKHGFIFEVRAKSPRVNLRNCISEVYTRGFFYILKNKFEEDPLCENSTCHKNKAVSNFSNTALFLKLEKNPRV